LLDRIEEKFIEKGFSMAQYSAFDGVLVAILKDYINGHFFKALSDHLNLFITQNTFYLAPNLWSGTRF
jgi:hypothetical protein